MILFSTDTWHQTSWLKHVFVLPAQTFLLYSGQQVIKSGPAGRSSAVLKGAGIPESPLPGITITYGIKKRNSVDPITAIHMVSLVLAVLKRSQPDILLAEHIIKSPDGIIKSPYGIIKSSAPVIKSPYGIIKSSAHAIKSPDGIIKSPAPAIMSAFAFIKLTECIITNAALIIMSCFPTIMHPYIIILSGSFIILSDSEAIIFSIAIIISTYTCTKDDKACIIRATQSGRLVCSMKSDPKYTAIQITRSIIKFINTLISEKINLTNNSTGYTVFNFSNHCCRISYKALPGKFRAVIEKYELTTIKNKLYENKRI